MRPITALLISVAALGPACAAEAGPCRDTKVTASLLKDVVAERWEVITPTALMARWPGLRRTSESAPPILSGLVRGAANEVVCGDYFYFAEAGGLTSVNLFISGTKLEVLEAARLFAAALGVNLNREEDRELQRESLLVSQRRTPEDPRLPGKLHQVAIEIAETGQFSHLTFKSSWLADR